MENYRENRVQLATKFKELGDENPYKTNTQFNAAFESETGIIVMIDDIKIHFGKTWTKEQFIKKFACDKPRFKDSAYCSSASSPAIGIDPVFSCINGYITSEGRKITPHKGGYVTFKTNDDNPSIWVFSKTGTWSQYNISTKKIDWTGKWECTGTASFSIISAGQQWLSSDNLCWVDIAEAKTEPTTESKKGRGGFT